MVRPEQRARVLAGYRFFVDIGALVGPLLLAGLLDAFGAPAAIVAVSLVLATGSAIAQLGIPRHPAAQVTGSLETT